MTKKILLIFGMFFFMITCFAQQGNIVIFLQPKAFATAMDTIKDAVILDVRTPAEFEKNRLEHAINIDWRGSDFEKGISQINTSTPVFVYCLSGARSKAAAEKMVADGFQKVYALEGGMLKWDEAKLPEIKTAFSSEGMTKNDFDKLIIPGKTVLVDFYAAWCAPCKEMEPFLHEIANENSKNVILLRINIDENPALADALKVFAIPYIQIYKNQLLTWENQGFTAKKTIEKHL